MNWNEVSSYKQALKDLLLTKKEHFGVQKYSFQKLAEACHVQKTYLSKVLNHPDTHLSPDQLYLALEFLDVPAQPAKLIQLLYELERTSLERRKTQLRLEIKKARARFKQTDQHLDVKKTQPGSEFLTQYYLDPDLQILHMLLTLDHFAADPKRACPVLNISTERLNTLLQQLEKAGLILLSHSNQVQVFQNKLHLPAHSPLIPSYRTLLRLKGLERLKNLSRDEGYSFSVLFSSPAGSLDKIRERFFQFVQVLEKESHSEKNSSQKEVLQLHFDLFPWHS